MIDAFAPPVHTYVPSASQAEREVPWERAKLAIGRGVRGPGLRASLGGAPEAPKVRNSLQGRPAKGER